MTKKNLKPASLKKIPIPQKFLLTILPLAVLLLILDILMSYFTANSIMYEPLFRLANQNIGIGLSVWFTIVALSIYQIYWVTRRIYYLIEDPLRRNVFISFSISFMPYHWFYIWFQDDKLVEKQFQK